MAVFSNPKESSKSPMPASFSIVRSKHADAFPIFTNQIISCVGSTTNQPPFPESTAQTAVLPSPSSIYPANYCFSPTIDPPYNRPMTMVASQADRELARSSSQNNGYFSNPTSPSPTHSSRSGETLERNIERWEVQRTTRRNVVPAGTAKTSLQGAIKTPQKISDIRTAYSRSTPQIGPLSAPGPNTKKKQLDRTSYDKEAEVNALTNLLVTKMNIPLDPNSYGLCTKCLKSVRFEEEGCTALDQLYHTRCFCCGKCGKSLKGVSFYAIEGKALCEADYMETLEKCASCKQPITERILRATGKPYHPKCFICVACRQCLDGIPFTVDASNQIHCIQDFHRKFAPRCSVCSDPIVPENGQEETVRIVCMDRNFHPKCYRCVDCRMALSSEEEGHGCYPLDGQVLCHGCNVRRVQALN